MSKIYKIYLKLYETYGPQGWWPFINYQGENFQKSGNNQGYHILDYSFPRNENELFEVCLGSILTQNTTFLSVVKSLQNLNSYTNLEYKKIKNLPKEKLVELITPSGFKNQKAQYILNFIEFFEKLKERTPTRDELLKIKGIGEETADSILLFGYKKCEFKVDAYTKRLLVFNNLIDEKANYKTIKNFMQDELKKENLSQDKLLIVYQEFHALIVEHSKRFYSKKPYGNGCFIKNII